MSTTAAIETRALVKSYGRRPALLGLDLRVEAGEVYGFLGPNGAGKTTTIRILLDLIRPTSGAVRVLGLDPARDGVRLRRRLGYLPGDFAADGRQTGRQLLEHLGHLRGGVARGRVDALAERLDLDLTRPVRSLSKGNRQKVGIVQAFMHDPELLVLDEPTSGLDPLMQQTFLDLVRETRAAGRTVFMSSHVLSEVQQAADRAGLVRAGELVTVESVESLRERAPRRVEAQLASPVDATGFSRLPDVHDVRVDGTVLHCRVDGSPDALVKELARHTVLDLVVDEADLEEIFLGYYTQKERVDVA
ncbi:MAG TPA: ABC transporter ATP-binding protein [Jiangellales bacterium]|nr:ABC transporter ATP-binding protein [Jiangellales bacterium]